MKIIEKEFVQTVKQLINENPGFVYECNGESICMYAKTENQPGCLFGQVFKKLEMFDDNEIIKLDNPIDPVPVRTILQDYGFSEATAMWSNSIQRNQDTGYSWGVCLEIAGDYEPVSESDITIPESIY